MILPVYPADLVLRQRGGGASGDDPTPRPTASPAATTLTTTLTTTTDFCANANTVPPGSDSENGKLVDWLNSLYTGYKADDPASPSGVTIRVADDFSFFLQLGLPQRIS